MSSGLYFVVGIVVTSVVFVRARPPRRGKDDGIGYYGGPS
jgi:hypothetical protein